MTIKDVVEKNFIGTYGVIFFALPVYLYRNIPVLGYRYA